MQEQRSRIELVRLFESGPKLKLEPLRVFILSGLPGVGKSTVARFLESIIDSSILQTDATRKELYPKPTYSREESEATYAEMISRSLSLLQQSETSVIMDGTYSLEKQRDDLIQMFREYGYIPQLVYVTAGDALTKKRIIERSNDISDADVQVYEWSKERFESPKLAHLNIVNDLNTEDLEELIISEMARTLTTEA